MEWLKNQLVQAKAGDKSARRRLLILGGAALVSVTLLISGQSKSEPVQIRPSSSEKSAIALVGGFVHISGAVVTPGVYPISSGMRLFEVIALAGGFAKNADQDSINLARTVADGEQILVSRGGVPAKSDGLIHLNRATVAELDKLPGLGPTLAARIIDWREANHGFQSIDDLRKVGGIGDKLFAALRKLVTL
jgi:competence protein ComEA